MPYRHDISHCFEYKIGKDGADPARYAHWLGMAAEARDALRAMMRQGELPILSLAGSTKDLIEIGQTAARLKGRFERLVVLGTGGSSLGGQAICALKTLPHKTPPVLFIDNVDPATLDQLAAGIDFSKTAFAVISKSGGTVETLTQALVMIEAATQARGASAIPEQFLAITIPQDNPLRRLAAKHDIAVLDHDPKVGGRFSVFSNVALIPAAFAGIDIRQLREGARRALSAAMENTPENSFPCTAAALHMALHERGKNITVMMLYGDRMAPLGQWYRQTWAESVGKDGQGTTPVRALGTIDQHSQLQLYLDGPRDKFITLLTAQTKKQGAPIPEPEDKELSYLKGRTVGDLLAAEALATADTLVKNNCPVRWMEVEKLNEESIGALLMHFMLETIVAARLMNVNPFDQPAVEEGKVLAREYLKKG